MPAVERVRRIVTFDANTEGYNRALREMQKASKDAAASLKSIDKNIKATARAAEQSASGISKLERSLVRVGALVRGFGAVYIAQTIISWGEAAAQAAVGLAQVEDQFNLLQVRIGRLAETGGAETAIRNVSKLASELGIAYADAGQAVALLAPAFDRLNRPFSEAAAFTEDLTKSLRLFGANARSSQIVTVQLAQALSSGQLAGDELRSLNENAGALGLALERAVQSLLGTTDTLKELGEAGQLTSDIVLEGFRQAFDKLRPEFEELPNLIQYSLDRAANAWNLFISGVSSNTGLRDALEDTLGEFTRFAELLALRLASSGEQYEKLLKFVSDQTLQEYSAELDLKLNTDGFVRNLKNLDQVIGDFISFQVNELSVLGILINGLFDAAGYEDAEKRSLRLERLAKRNQSGAEETARIYEKIKRLDSEAFNSGTIAGIGALADEFVLLTQEGGLFENELRKIRSLIAFDKLFTRPDLDKTVDDAQNLKSILQDIDEIEKARQTSLKRIGEYSKLASDSNVSPSTRDSLNESLTIEAQTLADLSELQEIYKRIASRAEEGARAVKAMNDEARSGALIKYGEEDIKNNEERIKQAKEFTKALKELKTQGQGLEVTLGLQLPGIKDLNSTIRKVEEFAAVSKRLGTLEFDANVDQLNDILDGASTQVAEFYNKNRERLDALGVTWQEYVQIVTDGLGEIGQRIAEGAEFEIKIPGLKFIADPATKQEMLNDLKNKLNLKKELERSLGEINLLLKGEVDVEVKAQAARKVTELSEKLEDANEQIELLLRQGGDDPEFLAAIEDFAQGRAIEGLIVALRGAKDETDNLKRSLEDVAAIRMELGAISAGAVGVPDLSSVTGPLERLAALQKKASEEGITLDNAQYKQAVAEIERELVDYLKQNTDILAQAEIEWKQFFDYLMQMSSGAAQQILRDIGVIRNAPPVDLGYSYATPEEVATQGARAVEQTQRATESTIEFLKETNELRQKSLLLEEGIAAAAEESADAAKRGDDAARAKYSEVERRLKLAKEELDINLKNKEELIKLREQMGKPLPKAEQAKVDSAQVDIDARNAERDFERQKRLDAEKARAAAKAQRDAERAAREQQQLAERRARFEEQALQGLLSVKVATGEVAEYTIRLTRYQEDLNNAVAAGLITQQQSAKYYQELQNRLKGDTFYDSLVQSVDPVKAATAELERGLLKLNDELRQNRITAEEAAEGADILAERYQDAVGTFESVQRQIDDAVGDAMLSWIDQAIDGTFDLKNALQGLLKDIAKLAFQFALISTFKNFGLFGYAKGGAFGATGLPHGIYSQPTWFPANQQLTKYARGGILGEAGPEAILPLTRTKSGDLGVKAQPSQVIVNINETNKKSDQGTVQTRTGKDGETLIDVFVDQVRSAMVDDVARGRGFAATLERQYGLNRARGAF